MSLFDFKTLKVNLSKETRTMFISLDNSTDDNFIDKQMIFELEKIVSWATNHIEINSIVFTSTKKIFSKGLDRSEFQNLPHEAIVQLLKKLQRVIFSLFHLPQTIIFDLKEGAYGVAAELSLGADIRVASKNCKISFDHLDKALTPTCGGIAALSIIFGHQFAKEAVLLRREFSYETLLQNSFLSKGQDELPKILNEINQMPALTRIQTKASFFEVIRENLAKSLVVEQKFAEATIKSHDWKLRIVSENTGAKFDYLSAQTIKDGIKIEIEA